MMGKRTNAVETIIERREVDGDLKEVLYRFIRAHYAEVLAVWPMTLLLIGLFIAVGIVSYNGHLAHGYTWKLRKKVMGGYILTHAPKNENEGDDIWY